MDIRFKELTITQFGPFTKTQTFRFPAKPGLYFMKGNNLVEPRLGGNGSGKTTLWGALYWLFFERNPRGLKAGDVANWGEGKGTCVELIYESGDSEFALKRTWSPNSWTLHDIKTNETRDLTKDSTNEVLSLLRLGPSSFLNCILMAQKQDKFLDQKATEKAARFSEVLNLDYWLECSARASKKAATQDNVIRSLERKLSELQGCVTSNKHEELSTSHDQWEVKRMKRLLEVTEEYEDELKNEKKSAQLIKDAEQQLERAKQAHITAKQDVDSYSSTLAKCRQRLSEAEKELAQADLKKNTKQDQYEFMMNHEHCPQCDQDIPDSVRDKKIKELEAESIRAHAEARRCFGVVKEAERKLNDELNFIDKKERKERETRMNVSHAEADLRDAKRNHELLQQKLDKLEDQHEDIEKEQNPIAALIKQAKQDKRALQEEIEDVQEELDEAKARYSRLSMWVKSFKEIRLQQMTNALQQLEIEVNSSMVELGLVDWELRFAVNRETKSGSIQHGFTVTVQSPHNTKPVPWEAWSGGETQRLVLAGQMGFANTTRERTGTPLNLEAWDEPTDNLSPEGIRDLLHGLKARAIREQRQIWIIDHRAFDFGGFDGVCTITKTGHGSRIAMDY